MKPPRSRLAVFAIVAGTACASSHASKAKRPEPFAIIYHQPFPSSCPPVDPTDTYWVEPPRFDAQATLSREFAFVRATLFESGQGDGTGCLRVDVKSPRGQPAVTALDVSWQDAPLVRLDQAIPYAFEKAPQNVVYSVGIPVKCIAEDRSRCLQGSVSILDVALASDGSKLDGFRQASDVGIRDARP
jgi:hypothetical protein